MDYRGLKNTAVVQRYLNIIKYYLKNLKNLVVMATNHDFFAPLGICQSFQTMISGAERRVTELVILKYLIHRIGRCKNSNIEKN